MDTNTNNDVYEYNVITKAWRLMWILMVTSITSYQSIDTYANMVGYKYNIVKSIDIDADAHVGKHIS